MLIGSWEPGSRKNFLIPSNLLTKVVPEPTVIRTFTGITANASWLHAVCAFQPWSQRSTQHNSTLQLSWVESGTVIMAFVTRPGHLSHKSQFGFAHHWLPLSNSLCCLPRHYVHLWPMTQIASRSPHELATQGRNPNGTRDSHIRTRDSNFPGSNIPNAGNLSHMT